MRRTNTGMASLVLSLLLVLVPQLTPPTAFAEEMPRDVAVAVSDIVVVDDENRDAAEGISVDVETDDGERPDVAPNKAGAKDAALGEPSGLATQVEDIAPLPQVTVDDSAADVAYADDAATGIVAQSDGAQYRDTAAAEDKGADAVQQESVSLRARTRAKGGTWSAWNTSGKSVTLGDGSADLSAVALKPTLKGVSGGIRYRAYVGGKGWQDWKVGPATAGTSDRNLESIRIELTGEVAESYDVYYRAKVSEKGWRGWTKNGKLAGSAGLGRSITSIKIKVVKKGDVAPTEGEPFLDAGLSGQAYVQGIGWQGKKSGRTITLGTTGRSARLEALRINRPINDDLSGSIVYQTHVQSIGWQTKKRNGQLAGTEGRALRVEALRVLLTGGLGKKYDVWYRTHVQGIV